jgi:leucyl aminopeptidase (aminopeptidase T)
MLTSDRLSRRLYDDVPAQFDLQAPAWDMKLAGLLDAQFILESGDEAALAGVAAERIAAREKTFQPVFKRMRERNVRIIFLGNGLYPTPSRAKQFGLPEAELAKLYWEGVNADYVQLQATGAKLKKVLSEGKQIHLTHPNGTDLKASVEKRPVMVSDGVIDEAKRKQGGAACWAYLPAGEVYVSPRTAEGRVVVDRVFFEGKEINDLVMEVKGGKVISLTAKTNGDRLQAAFKAAAAGKDRFGVIDVGINPTIHPPANSKVLAATPAGMVSVYIGNDTWAGGDNNTPFSLAGYLPGATLTVDGKVIVEKGELKP